MVGRWNLEDWEMSVIGVLNVKFPNNQKNYVGKLKIIIEDNNLS